MRKLISLLLSVIISFTAVGQEFSKAQIPYIPTNYIFNSGIENGLTGYGVYNDGDVAIPVDGIGGTATVSVATTTTLPLVGGRSLVFTKPAGTSHRGQGLNVKDFRIDDQAKGKVIRTSLDYEITSGTYATGDLAVWIYDVTNARWIQPSAYSIENSLLKETKFVEWQSSIDSNLYRLVVHVTSTSTSGYTVKFDSFGAGLGPKIYGSVTTDPVSYTPTITGVGTPTNVDFKYHKEGSFLYVRFSFAAGTVSGANTSFTLPSGFIGGLTTTQVVGYWGGQGTTNASPLFTTSSQQTIVYFGTNSNWQIVTTGTNIGTGSIVSGFVKIPIAGWSSSQQLSNDADTRVISGRVNKNSSQSISNDTATVVTFDSTPSHDYSSMWESGNSGWRIKTSGDYRVVARLAWASNASGTRFISIQKNGVNVATMYSTAHPAGEFMLGVDEIIPAVAGDLIRVSVYQNSGGSVNINNTSGNSFSIQRVSGPSQIAASEDVNVKYSTSAGQSIPSASDTIVDFGSKNYDSHNSVTTGGSWRFTAQVAGKYSYKAKVAFNSASFTNGNTVLLYAYKNGVQVDANYVRIVSTATHGYTVSISNEIEMLKGDYLDFRVRQDEGTNRTLTASALFNNVSIHKIGNY